MLHAYATPLELELVPSKQQQNLFLFIYALAALSILLLPWHFLLRLTCLVCVLLLSFFLSGKTPKYNRIVWQSDNNWLFTTGDITITAKLLPQSLVSFWLVMLLLKAEDGRCFSVIIWPDSVNPDAFRRLRVRLMLESSELVSKSVSSKKI